jgi:putative ABC transport system permease protein
VLKAMGFNNGLVLVLVLAESCAIALSGGVIGMVLAFAISEANPFATVLPSFNLPHRDLVTGVLAALALGIVAGTLPAIQAMRLQIATALRRN